MRACFLRLQRVPLVALSMAFCFVVGACSDRPPEVSIASAKNYLAKSDLNAAIIELKNALQQNPDLPEARYLLGKALVDRAEPSAGEVELRKARDLKYPVEMVVPQLAKALQQQGQYEKLIAEFGGDIDLESPNAVAELKTLLAFAYVKQGSTKEATAALDAAMRAVPHYIPAMVMKGRLLANQGRFADAMDEVSKVLAASPAESDALKLKGDILLYGDHDREEAIKAYRAAIDASSVNFSARGALVAALLAKDDLKSAKEQLDALKKVSPNPLRTRYLEAQWAFQNGDYNKAKELTEQLLKNGTELSLVQQLSGALAYQRGALEEAERALREALRLSPELEFARKLLARTYARSNRPARALETLAPLLNQPKPDAQTLSLAASIFLQSDEPKKAEDYYQRAIQLNSNDFSSRTALALIHLYQGKPAASFTELQSVARSDAGTTADLALIAAHVQRKDFKAALVAVDSLERKVTGKPLVPNLRGQISLLEGDLDGARRNFNQALSLDQVNFAAADGLAVLDVREKHPDVAAQRFDKILVAQPENVQALMAKAKLKDQVGKNDEAVELLTKAIKSNPTEPAPRLMLIDHYLQRRDYKKALAVAQDAASELPDNQEILAAFGRSQAASGDFNQAIATFNKLVREQPKSAQPLVALADVYVAAGQRDDAMRTLEQALKVAPDSLAAQQKLIALRVAAGRRSEALAVARDVQKQRPTEATGWVFEGDIETMAKNYGAASSLYRIALQKQGQKVGATSLAEKLHSSLLASGRRAEADAFGVQWLKAHPDDATFILYLGGRALVEQDFAEAESRFQQVVKLQPENPVALNNLAWATSSLGKPGALEFAEHANKVAPNQPTFMNTLAVILAVEKDLKRAIEVERNALALQPQNHNFRLTLARMYIDAGEKALARKELEQLAQLGNSFPKHEEVTKLMAQL